MKSCVTLKCFNTQPSDDFAKRATCGLAFAASVGWRPKRSKYTRDYQEWSWVEFISWIFEESEFSGCEFSWHPKLTCTQVKCSWILPTYVNEVPYARAKDIDFSSAKKLKEKLDQKIEDLQQPQASNHTTTSSSSCPSPWFVMILGIAH